MAVATKTLCVVAFLFLASNLQPFVVEAQQVPCYFIFGDSLADPGNNNGLATRAKVNYPPYGIDFPGGATGRFTNGRTTVDIITQLLGFNNNIPSFATASGKSIILGVNYASGSSGIRDDTGNNLGAHVSLNKQLQNHRATITRLTSILGDKTTDHLNRCLYTVGLGSNDYINNYFFPGSGLGGQFSPDQYAADLISRYSQQIKSLHDAGARRIALFGLGLIGCAPFELARSQNGSCVGNINSAVQLFNGRLKSLVDQLNKDFTDSKFIYINIFGILSGDPTKIGFKVTNAGCCPINDIGQCKPNSTPCPNRNEYAFFDGFHPTEAVNKITAARSYKAEDPSEAYPFDISRLVQQ